MKTYQVAHLKIQDQDMIIVPMDSAQMICADVISRNKTQEYIQSCASSAGLAGIVCLVWADHDSRTKFIAPKVWHPYFEKNVTVEWAIHNRNKSISCGG